MRSPGDPNGVALGQLQGRAYAALATHSAWHTAVLGALPPDVEPFVAANLDAAGQLTSLNTGPPATRLPHWTIGAPLPAAQLVADYRDAEAASRSRGRIWPPSISSRASSVGSWARAAPARRAVQFIPAPWAQYGRGNINDDHAAILAAGRSLAARGGTTNIEKTLFAYNADSHVRAVEDYAVVMLVSPAADDGYYQWPVLYQTGSGIYLLPEGYPSRPAVPRSG